MSTKTPHSHKHRGTEFQPVGSITIFDKSDFTALRSPTRNDLSGDGELAYAVAARHGLKQDFAAGREWERHAVLYLTADGDRVVERHVRGPVGDHSDIPRVIRARESKLSPTEGFAARIAPVVRRHPEVADE